MKTFYSLLLSLSLLACFGDSSRAAAYASTGSAGELLPSAEVISGTGELDSISGTLTLTNKTSAGALFEIFINSPSSFSASTATAQLGRNNFDTQLFLFNASGAGVVANDDTETSAQSFISTASFSSLASGNYYLLIEGSGRYPVDSEANLIFDNFGGGFDATGLYGPNSGAGAYAGLSGTSDQGGNYTIQLTGAQFVPVPEPGALALLAAGIGLLVLRRMPRKRLLWMVQGAALACASIASAGKPYAEVRVDEQRQADLAQRLPANMGRGLRELAATYDGLAAQVPDENTRADLSMGEFFRVQRDTRHRVLVDIYLDGTQTVDGVIAQIGKVGGLVIARVDWYRHGLVTAWIPVKRAEQLAASYGISAVNLAVRPQVRAGKTTSQGVAVHHTDTVNTRGYKGTGITVGVVSDSYNADTGDSSDPGFTTASADVVAGDLPGTGNPDGFTTPVNVVEEDTSDDSPTDEGRAMLQIVHDLAPAAKLAFATGGASESTMATNIGLLQSSGCKVLCDDLVFYTEPMFSDGVIAQAVDRVTAQGVSYFSAAGNDGHSGYAADFNPIANTQGLTRAAAGGVTTTGITSTERNAIVQWHSFGTDGSGNPIVVQNITTGSDTVTLDLQWDDPFDVAGGVTADFDILVFSAAGAYQSKLSSTDSNSSTKEPIELNTTHPLAANTSYKICIVQTNRIAAASRKASRLRYVALTEDVVTGDYITSSTPTSFGHCCASTAVGVAAYDYDIVASTTSHTFKPTVEDFSSNGPVKICFDGAGNRLAAPVLRKQPAISAVDGVNTSFFPPSADGASANDTEGDGFPNFYGTSAATPHAAAIAALLLNAASQNGLTVTPADIRTILINSAQKLTDQDPNFCSATAGPVTITATGDTGNASASSNNFFQVSLNGSSGQHLTKVTIDLSPVGLHFDSNANTGHAFAVGSTSGSTTPAFASAPTAGIGSTGSSATAKATVNFSNFVSGDTLAFGVDRDEDLSSSAGNGADEIGGLTAAGGGTITATVDGITYTGTFFNRLGGAYNYKAGYGLLDAAAALNYLLGL